ncbi:MULTISPECIES: hypothetical protein [Cohnella]|uniref:hypothetical protein n=1 Tax=Cohnella TaxID=329857 RepID=UPI0012EC2B38|nr:MULTISPECIES: hypothetical protein [Cohnella]
MDEGAMLLLALIGLFGLIGAVMAAVAHMVSKDSAEYDRRIVWKIKGYPNRKNGSGD